MSAITTHVLDTAAGRPAAGIEVTLERLGEDGKAALLARGHTDADGRLRDLLPAGRPAEPGEYRLVFETGAYHRARGVDPFYPRVSVAFLVSEPGQHFHVPLLLSPFGYSTYRGS